MAQLDIVVEYEFPRWARMLAVALTLLRLRGLRRRLLQRTVRWVSGPPQLLEKLKQHW